MVKRESVKTDVTDQITQNLGDLVNFECDCGNVIQWCFDCYKDDVVTCGVCGARYTFCQSITVTKEVP